MPLLERLVEINAREWQPVSPVAMVGATLCFVVVCYLANTGEQWVFVLDSANLVFHEAGHPLFGLLLGQRMTVYGGTLGQLVFPLVAMGSFWQRREAVSLALCAGWLCQNFWNIARYMADARRHVLPLVGNGEHDWTEIFSQWHILHRDTVVASVVSLVAWIGISAAWGWLAWRWRQGGADTAVR